MIEQETPRTFGDDFNDWSTKLWDRFQGWASKSKGRTLFAMSISVLIFLTLLYGAHLFAVHIWPDTIPGGCPPGLGGC
jgi:hypothetical protein